MIYLISGASHSGKTKLMQRLIEKFHYPAVSIDHLKMGLIRSKQTQLTTENDDLLIPYLWPIVREMIKTAIENNQNMILEGVYIPFDWWKDFDEFYIHQITYICICLSQEYILNHFEEIKKHSCDIEERKEENVYIEELLMDNEKYCKGCLQNRLFFIMIKENYEEEMNLFLQEIIQK